MLSNLFKNKSKRKDQAVLKPGEYHDPYKGVKKKRVVLSLDFGDKQKEFRTMYYLESDLAFFLEDFLKVALERSYTNEVVRTRLNYETRKNQAGEITGIHITDKNAK